MKNIIPLYGADIRDDYNRQLRAKRLKMFIARCCVIAAGNLLVLGIVGMISFVHTPIFSALVTSTLIAGFWGWRYLTTRH